MGIERKIAEVIAEMQVNDTSQQSLIIWFTAAGSIQAQFADEHKIRTALRSLKFRVWPSGSFDTLEGLVKVMKDSIRKES